MVEPIVIVLYYLYTKKKMGYLTFTKINKFIMKTVTFICLNIRKKVYLRKKELKLS